MVSGGGKRSTPARVFPASRLLAWHSALDDARSRHASLVRGHALGQQLEVVLPSRAAGELAAALQWETSFFYEITAPLSVLLSPKFIREYLVDGALYMVPKNVAADIQNTALLLPTGELRLLVDNETYEQLGLVGHKYAQQVPAECQPGKHHVSARRSQRFVVVIDLKRAEFAQADTEPSASRERVLHCLETKLEPLTMLVAAYNERGAPRTIIFGDDDTIERTRIEVNGHYDKLEDMFVPALHEFLAEKATGIKLEMEQLRASLESVYDWLGVVACRLTDLLQQQPLEAYVTTFDGQPDAVRMEEHGEMSVLRWRGLITSEFVQRIVDRTRDGVSGGKIPWAAVSVWGFPDAIVSWQQEYDAPLSRAQQKKLKKKAAAEGTDEKAELVTPTETVTREHGYLLNGNNNYTFLLLPQHEYYLLQDIGPHDATV